MALLCKPGCNNVFPGIIKFWKCRANCIGGAHRFFCLKYFKRGLASKKRGRSSVIASKRMVNSFGAKSADEKSRDLSGFVDTVYGYRPQNTASEAYEKITDNAFKNVSDESLSTFSIDVDTASYTNLCRF